MPYLYRAQKIKISRDANNPHGNSFRDVNSLIEFLVDIETASVRELR
jgi:hypothetical protein